MAKIFLTNLDLAKNQLLNAVLQNLASDPSSPVAGQTYYNTTSNQLRVYNATRWVVLDDSYVASFTVDNVTIQNTGSGTAPSISLKSGGITNTHISASAAIALTKLATDPLARANHTGTQTASTISDLATVVQAYRLDQFAVPTADLNVNSHKITGLATPTGGTDAVTKAYADALKTGLDFKDSVRAASTANLTLSGTQTVDGVSLIAGDRILVKNQTTASQNGIYVVASGAWSRSTDADQDAEVTGGMYVLATEGTTNGDSAWVLTTNDPITVGTTSLSFAQFSGGGSVSGGAGLVLTGSVLDVVGTAGRILVNADSIDIDSGYVGQTSITTLGTITTGTWTGTAVAVANGGTGATTAAGARTNLAATTKYAQDVGDGSATAIVVTHSLGTRDVVVKVRNNSGSFEEVMVDVEMTSTNTVTLRFAVAPASNAYRVIIIG